MTIITEETTIITTTTTIEQETTAERREEEEEEENEVGDDNVVMEIMDVESSSSSVDEKDSNTADTKTRITDDESDYDTGSDNDHQGNDDNNNNNNEGNSSIDQQQPINNILPVLNINATTDETEFTRNASSSSSSEDGSENNNDNNNDNDNDDNDHFNPRNTVNQNTCCNRYCSRCLSTNRRTLGSFLLMFVIISAVILYFTVPWSDFAERVIEYVKTHGPLQANSFLFGVHLCSIFSIFGPTSKIEFAWVYMYGWIVVPIIILSYIIAVSTMLFIGTVILRDRVIQWFCYSGEHNRFRVREHHNEIFTATKDVVSTRPYLWFFLFQFWGIMQWEILVYFAPFLIPIDCNLFLIGVAVVGGQLPKMLYTAFLGTRISDLDTLVTGQFDTTIETIVVWSSLIITVVISVVLYFKIRNKYMEAVARYNSRNDMMMDEEQTATDYTETVIDSDDEDSNNNIFDDNDNSNLVEVDLHSLRLEEGSSSNRRTTTR